MLNSDQRALIEFVEDCSVELPLRLRIKIYRGLADFMPAEPRTRALSRSFVARALILEEAEQRVAGMKTQRESRFKE